MSTPGPGVRRAASRVAPALLVAALALPGLTSCQGDGGSDSSAPIAGTPTPLEKLDTTGLVVGRTSFCSSVASDAVEAALDSADYQGDEYGNGDAAQITDEVKDVAHEYGCTWRTDDGHVARAWVFAPPVTPERAKRLRAGALRQGCSATRDGADFGSISVATTCGGKDSTVQGYFGLFGDAWLSCTLGVTGKQQPEDLPERTSDWCAAVLKAASA
jgi:hypothetical protein